MRAHDAIACTIRIVQLISHRRQALFSMVGENSAFCPSTTDFTPLLLLRYDGLPVRTVRRAWALQVPNWGRHKRRPLTRIESCRVWLVGCHRQEGQQPTEPGHPHLSSGALSLLLLLVMGTACALAFLAASLCLLPRVGADILRKLVFSVSSPRIQTSHWSADR